MGGGGVAGSSSQGTAPAITDDAGLGPALEGGADRGLGFTLVPPAPAGRGEAVSACRATRTATSDTEPMTTTSTPAATSAAARDVGFDGSLT